MVKAVVGANWGDEGKGKINSLSFTLAMRQEMAADM